jgi:nucleoside phosphorylase
MPIIDFAILTGLLEEFEALRRLFPALQEHSDNANIWYRTTIAARNKRPYSVVISFQNEMGPLDAHDLTTKVIGRWDPAYIILLGIAGTFDKAIKLGDVAISQQVFYYDPGKAVPKKIAYRPQGYPCSTILVRQTEAFRVDPFDFKEWKFQANKSALEQASKLNDKKGKPARDELGRHQPEIHFGTVASGSLVIADKKKRAELLRLHGKIIATEMEGAGVLHATFRQEMPTPAIVIKGISDAADLNKSVMDAKKYWRVLAAENSVRVALQLITRGQIRPLYTDLFSIDTTLGSPAEAMSLIGEGTTPGHSLCAFPRLVVPRGPLTELSIAIHASGELEGQECNLEVIRFVTQYHARGERRVSERLAGTKEYKLSKILRAKPIGAYFLLRGVPQKVTFVVRSPGLVETATLVWN